jgi:hypothetical protein
LILLFILLFVFVYCQAAMETPTLGLDALKLPRAWGER